PKGWLIVGRCRGIPVTLHSRNSSKSSLLSSRNIVSANGSVCASFSPFPRRFERSNRRRGHVFCSSTTESLTPPPREAVHGREANPHRQERPRPWDVSRR